MPAATQPHGPPAVELRVGGRRVDAAVAASLVEVDVSEEIYHHGRCSLLIQNWRDDERRVRWSDDGPFAPGAEIELLLGRGSDLRSVFSGLVTALTAHFPANQKPLLQVEARSRSILLSSPCRSRIMENTDDADVVSALASDAGLTADVGQGAHRPSVVLDRRSAWDYIVRRGRDLGWAVYVRGTRLVMKPPAPLGDPLEVTWNIDLVELRLTQDIGLLPRESTAAAWDSETQTMVSSATESPTGGLVVGDRDNHQAVVERTGWPNRDDLVSTAAARGADDLDGRSGGLTRRAELRHMSGSGLISGNPKLRCDSWIKFTGGGKRFSGPYYVSAVRHRFGMNGFTTEFGVGIAEPLVPPASSDRGAVGDAPLLIGVVTDVADPSRRARVKVAFPWSAGTDSVWARVMTPYAGSKAGMWFVPDRGQEVVVGFIDGSDDDPVVVGSVWSGAAQPPGSPDAGNTVRSIVTRAGHVLKFDDSDNAAVTLATAGGHQLVLSDSDGEIMVKAKGGNSITLSDSGIDISASKGDITLSAASGEVSLNAVTISSKADASTSLESAATVDIKASATLGLRGGIVNIN